MIRFTANDTFLVKDLVSLHDTTEIWDANGKLLGVFVPGNMREIKGMAAKATGQQAPSPESEEIRCTVVDAPNPKTQG